MTARLKVAILDDYSRLCIMLNSLLSRSFPTVRLQTIIYSDPNQQRKAADARTTPGL